MSKVKAQSLRRAWALLRVLPRPGYWVTGKACSMRISLGGVYSVAELSKSFDRVAQALAANGVEEIRGINLYVTLFRDRRSMALIDEHGQEIEHLKFDEPARRPFKSVTGKIGSDTIRKVKITRPAPEDPA
jgi:hypothetical protein